jgi:hypothetical protein
MTIVEIIPLLIAGENVRRNSWRHDTRYLFLLVSASDAETVTILYRDDSVSTYHVNNRDFWADDWELLP